MNSQNNQDSQKKRREPICIDDNKLRLYGKPLREGARSPMCRVKLIENNPCIEVDYGYKTEGKNGKEGYPIKLELPMAPVPFQTLLELIKRVAAFKGQCGFESEVWGFPFIYDKEQGKNVRSPDRLCIGRIAVMKRDDGMVVLGFAAKNKDAIEFEFKPDEYHPITQNGQPASVDITSSLAATAWAEVIGDVYRTNYATTWTEPEYQKKRRLENMQRAQQRQGGGYQNNGNGGYGNSNNAQPRQQQGGNGNGYNNQGSGNNGGNFGGNIDSFDEDLPF